MHVLIYFFFQKVMRTEERKTVPKSHCEELSKLLMPKHNFGCLKLLHK